MSVAASWANTYRFKVVVVLASLGGLPAVTDLLRLLPQNFRVPLLLIQHRQIGADIERLTNLLQIHSRLSVVTATDGLLLRPHTVSVVPGGVSVTFDRTGRVKLTPSVNGHSGDGALASAAETFGPSAIAVVLSGMLDDGTAGVRAIKRRGGRVLAQDPSTARAASMPAGAIATGCVDYVLPPQRLATAITALTMAPGGAELLVVAAPHWARQEA